MPRHTALLAVVVALLVAPACDTSEDDAEPSMQMGPGTPLGDATGAGDAGDDVAEAEPDAAAAVDVDAGPGTIDPTDTADWEATPQRCLNDSDCPDGELCTWATYPPQCSSGEQGSPCEDADECKAPWGCNKATEPPHCGGAEGEACKGEADCSGEMVCNPALSTVEGFGACAPPQEKGGPCSGDPVCAAGLVCVIPIEQVGRCSTLLEEGEHCSQVNQCRDGLVCHTAGKAVGWYGACLPPSKVDGPCEWDGECADGLRCNKEDGTCV